MDAQNDASKQSAPFGYEPKGHGPRRTLADEIRWFETDVAAQANSEAGRALILAASALFADLRRHARQVAARRNRKALSGRSMSALDALRQALLGAGALKGRDDLPARETSSPTPALQATPAKPRWERPTNCACVPGSGVMCQPCADEWSRYGKAARGEQP